MYISYSQLCRYENKNIYSELEVDVFYPLTPFFKTQVAAPANLSRKGRVEGLERLQLSELWLSIMSP